MKNRWMLLSLTLIVAAIVILSVTIAAAADQQVVKVGKKGDIIFTQETMVGDLTLKPGHYQILHRAEGEDHLFHFVELKGHNPYQGWQSYRWESHAGEVKCRIEAMDAKASETKVMVDTEGGTRRVTRIEIRGENVAHLF